MDVPGKNRTLAACLAIITLTGCESQLCKTAKGREAEAILEQQKAENDYEGAKKNKESSQRSIKQAFKKQGLDDSLYDYEKEHEAFLSKLLNRLVFAYSDESSAKELRLRACSSQ